jgi:hypothetical protein
LETERIDFNGRLEADAQIIVVHLVKLRTRVQQADMARDREQEVVVEGWQPGELILEHLGCRFGALARLLDSCLNLLWKDFIGKVS